MIDTKVVIRDLVFGMEDGLVSNLGIVLGMYVGGAPSFTIVLAGLASMLAGAFSMSAGSYLSAKAQREVYEQEINATKEKLRENPQQCLLEMCLLLKEEGFSKKEVGMMCDHFSRHNNSSFIKNYIQKKVGLSEARFDLPIQNALAMFLAFVLGSAFPIVPFVLWQNSLAAVIAGGLTVATLFGVGWLKTIYTQRNPWKSGLEIVVIGIGAGLMGYVVGLLVG